MSRSSNMPPQRKGMALVYGAALLVVLIGFVGLAVDVGRAQYVKAELQVLADVAARAAAKGIADNTTLAKANAVASYNPPQGGAITFTSGDVVTGNWNPGTKSFTAGGTPTNAVRVTAARSSANGNALPTLFLNVLGASSTDVVASAVATGSPGSSAHGVFGSNWVKLYSNVRVDSYDSSVGPYSAAWTPDNGDIATNGPIHLDSTVIVRGDARPGPGSTVSGGGTVTGITTPLPAPMTIPAASANGYGPANNNNSNIPATYRPGQNFSVTSSVTVNMPAGNYYFTNFTMTNGSVLNVTGAATVYITGDLFFDGDSRTSVHRPQNLKFVMLGNGADDVRLIGNNGVYANIYAPNCDVTLDSNKQLYGTVVARKVDAYSNAQIHVDESLVAASGGGGATVVQVVR